MSNETQPDTQSYRQVFVPGHRPVCMLHPGMQPTVFEHFGRDCIAWTKVNFDRAMQPLLVKLGLWQGRGFCCYLHVPFFAKAPERFAGTVSHECAHWLASPIDEADGEEPGKEYFLTMMAHADGCDPPDQDDNPWRHHGVQFVRACYHLRRRAWLAGWSCRCMRRSCSRVSANSVPPFRGLQRPQLDCCRFSRRQQRCG